MAHPSYPHRALDRRWRTSYKRRGRHLTVLAGLVLAGWVTTVWVVLLPIAR